MNVEYVRLEDGSILTSNEEGKMTIRENSSEQLLVLENY